MEGPLEIVFDNLDHSPAVENIVREKSRKLERFYERLIDARVVIAREGKSHHQGNSYHVTIEANVPGRRLVVSKGPGRRALDHEELLPTVNDAFDAMVRQLEEYNDRQGDVRAAGDIPSAI